MQEIKDLLKLATEFSNHACSLWIDGHKVVIGPLLFWAASEIERLKGLENDSSKKIVAPAEAMGNSGI
jgi:hypothetical protein